MAPRRRSSSSIDESLFHPDTMERREAKVPSVSEWVTASFATASLTAARHFASDSEMQHPPQSRFLGSVDDEETALRRDQLETENARKTVDSDEDSSFLEWRSSRPDIPTRTDDDNNTVPGKFNLRLNTAPAAASSRSLAHSAQSPPTSLPPDKHKPPTPTSPSRHSRNSNLSIALSASGGSKLQSIDKLLLEKALSGKLHDPASEHIAVLQAHARSTRRGGAQHPPPPKAAANTHHDGVQAYGAVEPGGRLPADAEAWIRGRLDPPTRRTANSVDEAETPKEYPAAAAVGGSREETKERAALGWEEVGAGCRAAWKAVWRGVRRPFKAKHHPQRPPVSVVKFQSRWAAHQRILQGTVSVLRVEPGCRWWRVFAVVFDDGELVAFKRKSHFVKRKKAVFAAALSHAKLQTSRDPDDTAASGERKHVVRVQLPRRTAANAFPLLFLATRHRETRDRWATSLQSSKLGGRHREAEQELERAEAEAGRERPEGPTVVESLVDRRANPNCLNRDGNTPLHFAAFNGDEESVAALLRLRAMVYVDPSNESGVTPLGVASQKGHDRVVALLIEAGARHLRMLV